MSQQTKKSAAGKTAAAKKAKPVKKPVAGKTATGKKKIYVKPKVKIQKNRKAKKNVSQTIPNGRTLQTRDDFFENQGHYKKPGYEKKGLYRKVVVVDSNKDDELAVVKLTTSKRGRRIKDYKKGKSRYRPYVETKDDKGRPIKLSGKFVENPPSADIPPKSVAKIKKSTFKSEKQSIQNRKKVRALKKRK